MENHVPGENDVMETEAAEVCDGRVPKICGGVGLVFPTFGKTKEL